MVGPVWTSSTGTQQVHPKPQHTSTTASASITAHTPCQHVAIPLLASYPRDRARRCDCFEAQLLHQWFTCMHEQWLPCGEQRHGV